MSSFPRELLYYITQHLTHRAYASLLLMSKSWYITLTSEHFLSSRARKARLDTASYYRGLIYLTNHKLVNYSKEFLPQDTYFRFFDDGYAVDIFDRMWKVSNCRLYLSHIRLKQLERPYIRIKKIFRYETPMKDDEGWFCYLGRLILTFDGKIISYCYRDRGDMNYIVKAEDLDQHERVTTIIKDADAIDLECLGGSFIYQKKSGECFMSDMLDEAPLTVPIRDIQSVRGYMNDDRTKACLNYYIDQTNTLHHYQATPSVKQVRGTYECNFYLREDGDLVQHNFRTSKEHEVVLAKNVVMFDYAHPYDFYLIVQESSGEQQLQHLHQSWRSETYSLTRSLKLPHLVKRIQACTSGDILIEYE